MSTTLIGFSSLRANNSRGLGSSSSSSCGLRRHQQMKLRSMNSRAVRRVVAAVNTTAERDDNSKGHDGSHTMEPRDLIISHLLPLRRPHSRQQFVVRSSDIGQHGKASMQTIAHLLQDTISRYGKRSRLNDEYFATPSMKKQGLIRVIRRMHIEVNEYPVMDDVLDIDTWIEPKGATISCYWLVNNLTNTNSIGKATSACVLFNKSTRTLVKMNKKVQEELQPFLTQVHGEILFKGDKDNIKIPNIQGLQADATYAHFGLKPRRRDIDINQHINNVIYIDWLVEVIPQNIFDMFELTQITMEFYNECQQNDELESIATLENSKCRGEISIPNQTLNEAQISLINKSSTINFHHSNHELGDLDTKCHETLQFIHLLRHATRDGRNKKINRARTQWKIKSFSTCNDEIS